MDAALRERVDRAAAVARANADSVDREARFPQEAFEALRQERLMGLMISPDEGGEGLGFTEVGEVCEALGAACANTGMVYAMHQNQVAGLVTHADTPYFAERRRRIVDEQLLVASATTELGIGGDIRSSTCAVEVGDDGTFDLVKNAPVISYGQYADLLFVTARRSPDAERNDQVLVCCDKGSYTLEPTGEWNVLGFRGTCSPGFVIHAHATTDAIFPAPFQEISSRRMLPGSHMLWASTWLGIASEAVQRARAFVMQAARRNPGVTPPGALRLAEVQVRLQAFADSVHNLTRRMDSMAPDSEELGAIAFTIAMNGLKISASQSVAEIVHDALLITGIAGYREDNPFSLSRMLRDSVGAAIMVNNDRILGNSASLELINRRGGSW